MSPFSKESASTREFSYTLWRTVISGSSDLAAMDQTGPAAQRLPQLLWLYAMAMVAVWSQDPTESAERTERVIRRSAPLMAQVSQLAINPLFAPAAQELVGLIEEISTLREP